MSSPLSPSCKSPLSPLSPGATKKHKVRRLRPLPLYTEQPAEGEVVLPSQPSDFACMNLVADAAAAARRARSPQVAKPPTYESLYSPERQHHMAPSYSAIDERIEFLRDLPKKAPASAYPMSAITPSRGHWDADCSTCQAGVSCPVHPHFAFRMRGRI